MNPRQPRAQERHPEFLEDQRQFFDELITEEWQSYIKPDWDTSRHYEIDRLFRHVQPESVLDVGCGCGYHDLLMARRPETRQIHAIDYSAKSIETANREYPHEKVVRQVGDINALGPGLPEVDLAVSFQVIEHTTDAARFLTNCAAQVRAGGHVAVFTPNRLRLSNRLRLLLGRPEKLSDPQHFREFTIQDLSELGQSLGLAPVAAFGYGLDLHWIGRRLPMRWRLALGSAWQGCADGICVIFRVESRSQEVA